MNKYISITVWTLYLSLAAFFLTINTIGYAMLTPVQLTATIFLLAAVYISAYAILRFKTPYDNNNHPCLLGLVFLLAPIWIIPVWIYLSLHTLGTLINKQWKP